MFRGMLVFVIGLAITAVTVMPVSAGGHMPEADAKAVWSYITKDSPYTKWKMWPGKEGIYPGKSPHGAFLKLYVNDIAYEAAKAAKPMPDGAIIVKENYAEDKKTLAAITPMYKKKGFNPEAGDWWWAKYKPDGTAAASGKVKSCIECHAAAKKADYLFSKKK